MSYQITFYMCSKKYLQHMKVFDKHEYNPKCLLEIFQTVKDVDPTVQPQNYGIEDKATKVWDQQKANFEAIFLNIRNGALVLPQLVFHSTKDLCIWSQVSHQSYDNKRQWLKTSFAQYKHLCIIWKSKSRFSESNQNDYGLYKERMKLNDVDT